MFLCINFVVWAKKCVDEQEMKWKVVFGREEETGMACGSR